MESGNSLRLRRVPTFQIKAAIQALVNQSPNAVLRTKGSNAQKVEIEKSDRLEEIEQLTCES
ncbi:hypothetical protein K3727_12545 [Rhodobacteraceae bacterium M382]|nr:hypothetical protein K3727_12545 [Rhodobacteraceae bacterium M382]